MQKYFLLFNKYFFYILIILIGFIVLYPKFPLLNIKGTYVAIRLEDFLIALTLLAWLGAKFKNFKKYLSDPIYQAFVLFWLIGLLGVVSALLLTFSVKWNLALFNYLRRIEVMSLFFVGATSFSSLKQIKIMLAALVFITLVVIGYGFGQQWLHFPVISTTNKEFSKGLILFLTGAARVNSTFAGHYDLAAFLAMVLAFLSSLFFYYKKISEKGWIILTGVGSFILLGMTAARVSFVATFLAITLSLWLNSKKILIVLLIIASLATLAVIPDLRHRLVATVTVNLLNGGGPKYNPPAGKVNIFTPIEKIPANKRAAYLAKALQESTLSATQASKIAVDIAPGEPLNSTELGVERSYAIRFNVEWPRALRAFLKNPFLGTGYSSITLATDNDYLRSLGETGLLGTIALGLIFYFIICRMLTFLKRSQGFERFFIIGSLCMIVTILVSATFIDVLEASKIAEIFWLIVGVSWALMGEFKDV